MAQYQIMYWKKVPAQVRVSDPHGDRSAMLPPRFQAVIDDVAMRFGLLDTDDYLDGWQWGPAREMDGAPEAVLQRVLADLDARHPATPDALLNYFLDRFED